MTLPPTEAPLLSARGLQKTFRIGFLMRRVEALRDATFDVHRGEILGLVGPNGAGKTTTLKILMGLIRADAGSATMLGQPISNKEARRRVAYLPETPHFYDYLKPAEFLDYFGDLYGVDPAEKKRRIPELLERVGLQKAVDKPLRKFSKGMLQRVGLAQALLPDAELVILDEPQSGLDPIGRRDIRDLILEENTKGKTVIMCTHVLPDVEQICDRVVIMHLGRVVRQGRIHEVVPTHEARMELRLANAAGALDALRALGATAEELSDGTTLFTLASTDASNGSGSGSANEALQAALQGGATVLSLETQRPSLEDVFTAEALRTDAPEDDR